MPKQDDSLTLPITLGLRSLGKKAGSRLLAIVREIVRASGKQESGAADVEALERRAYAEGESES